MRVLKWNVPVDDLEHEIGGGPVALVRSQWGPEAVQVWTVEANEPVARRQARVFGTGQQVPDSATHLGSDSTADGLLVWHLFDVTGLFW